MSKHEQIVRSAVSLRGTISVKELTQLLGVSDQTVRRIIKPLVAAGEVHKVHGAIVSTRSPADPPFLARMNLNRGAKVAIAQAVVAEIADGDSLAIDTGSTSAFIAQALQARRRLTVVTNSAFVASTLAMVEGNRVFMAGTQLRDHDGAAFDRTAFEVIERARAHYAILSASLVDPVDGFLVYEQGEADVIAAMKAIAAQTFLAVDHSKFEPQRHKPSLKLPALTRSDTVFTSRQPPAVFDELLAVPSIRVAGSP